MSLNQDVSSCPLAPSVIAKLDEAGFHKVCDLVDTTALELSRELSIDIKEAVDILNVIRGPPCDNNKTEGRFSPEFEKPESVTDLLSNEQNQLKIVTFCAALDDVLGGGIPVQKITEVCGTPGIGKTQFAIQLAVDVQIPTVFGGLDGEAVYIDTEGSLTLQRVVDVAKAASRHIVQVAKSEGNDEELTTIADQFTYESILAGVYLFRCLDYVEVIAVSNLLPEFIKSHPKVKLIILDSIAFHFRQEFCDMIQRTCMLQGLVQKYHALASEHKLAVVIINQMTTKFSKDSATKEGQMVPALGDSWGHACNNRIVLSFKDGIRYAHLVKSSSRRDAVVPFSITGDGIRDIVNESQTDETRQ